jgi:fatty acid desaturase
MTATVAKDLQAYKVQKFSLWNAIALLYVVLGYVGGIALLCLPSPWLNGLGTFLLTHSLICSAYLAHDCMHNAVGKGRRLNGLLGNAMLWINGGCYYGFDRLALQHIAHHVQRIDSFTFDIPSAIKRLPHVVRIFVLTLEWFYFPVVGFWSRWRSLLTPFWNPAQRREIPRVVTLLLIRGTLYLILGITSLKALVLYFMAYIAMITVLRWMDAFQHTYEAFPPGSFLPKRDRDYEQTHTFSPLLSSRFPWLNILVLNFGYHNAHHALMTASWYHLPEIHAQFIPDNDKPTISLMQQLTNYHRFRVRRLLCGQGEAIDQYGNFSLEHFFGAADVSFLMLY